MKQIFTLFIIFSLFIYNKSKAQVNTADSLALVDLYNSAGGSNWTNHSGWLKGPIKNWFGVGIQWTYDQNGNIVFGRVNTLDLRSNHLNGTLPASIGNLSELTFLVLFNDTLLRGNIPFSLGNLTKLSYLFIAGNGFTGPIPTSIGNLQALTSLYLEDNKLSGEIPSNIGGLVKLTNLYLEGNQFTGNAPDWIGYNLINLQHLDLSFNQLSGAIPSSLGLLSNLLTLSLYSNKLSGSIPTDLGNLDLNKIQSIWLSFNNLTGSIPSTLGYLKTLQQLALDNNQISGAIPDEVGNLQQLQTLTLQNNKLSGSLPKTFDYLLSLKSLNISSNQLSGPIPQNIGNLPLADINISSNKFVFDKGMEKIAAKSFAIYYPQDSIPINVQTIGIGAYKFSASAYFSNPFGFDLGDNVFGNVKFNWWQNNVHDSDHGLNNIDSIYIPSAQNSGLTYTYWSIVTDSLCPKLTLYSRHYTTTPVFITVPSNDSLYLTRLYNTTNGPTWTTKTNWLALGKPISTWYGITVNGSGRVTSINLPSNNLTGTIPDADSIGALANLQTLNLPNNAITGSLPATLGNLANLQTLNFGSNKLSGSIPSSFGNLTSLSSLTLNFNSLSGNIPTSLGNLSKLTVLDMWVNQFSGSIPTEIGNLTNLTTVWLGWNQLSGSIPNSLSNLNKLQELHLDNNQLSGTLPAQLTNFTQLTGLVLGNNQFTFDGLEGIVQKYAFAIYTPQATIPITNSSNILTVSAGGTLANNTYKWYKNGALVDSVKGVSTYMPNSNGNYSVQVTNSLATKLILYSDVLSVNNFSFVLASTNTVSVQPINNQTLFYNNNFIINTITPSGTSPVSGNVTSKVTFDASVQSQNGKPYLQRHYDIEPSVNANAATATVTLYYTQGEFDRYNTAANLAGLALLPSDALDVLNNKMNLRVNQFHGTGTSPDNYSGYTGTGASTVIITPTTVFWNSSAARWEVTFPVTGFSGFYVSTIANAVLPVSLLSFDAVVQNSQSLLRWSTAMETNNKGFDIERSSNTNNFSKIGFIAGHGSTNLQQNYLFTDARPLIGSNYYRLTQIDLDGNFNYSNTILVTFNGRDKILVFPNPASKILHVSTNGLSSFIQLSDIAGHLIKSIKITGIDTTIDVANLSTGTYICSVGGANILFLKQ